MANKFPTANILFLLMQLALPITSFGQQTEKLRPDGAKSRVIVDADLVERNSSASYFHNTYWGVQKIDGSERRLLINNQSEVIGKNDGGNLVRLESEGYVKSEDAPEWFYKKARKDDLDFPYSWIAKTRNLVFENGMNFNLKIDESVIAVASGSVDEWEFTWYREKKLVVAYDRTMKQAIACRSLKQLAEILKFNDKEDLESLAFQPTMPWSGNDNSKWNIWVVQDDVIENADANTVYGIVPNAQPNSQLLLVLANRQEDLSDKGELQLGDLLWLSGDNLENWSKAFVNSDNDADIKMVQVGSPDFERLRANSIRPLEAVGFNWPNQGIGSNSFVYDAETALRRDRSASEYYWPIINFYQHQFFRTDYSKETDAGEENPISSIPGLNQVSIQFNNLQNECNEFERRTIKNELYWCPKALSWKSMGLLFLLASGTDECKYIQSTEMPTYAWAHMIENEKKSLDQLLNELGNKGSPLSDAVLSGVTVDEQDDADTRQKKRLARIALSELQALANLDRTNSDYYVPVGFTDTEDRNGDQIKSLEDRFVAWLIDSAMSGQNGTSNPSNFDLLILSQLENYFLHRLVAAHHQFALKDQIDIRANIGRAKTPLNYWYAGKRSQSTRTEQFVDYYRSEKIPDNFEPNPEMEPIVFVSANAALGVAKSVNSSNGSTRLFNVSLFKSGHSEAPKLLVRLPFKSEVDSLTGSTLSIAYGRVYAITNKPLTAPFNSPFISEWVFRDLASEDSSQTNGLPYLALGSNRRSVGGEFQNDLEQGIPCTGRSRSLVIGFRYVIDLSDSKTDQSATQSSQADEGQFNDPLLSWFNLLYGLKQSATDEKFGTKIMKHISTNDGPHDYWKYEHLRAVIFADYWETKDGRDDTARSPKMPWDELSDKDMKKMLEVLLAPNDN